MCKGASGGSIDIDPEPFQACRMALLLCKAPLFWKPLNRRHFWVSSIPTNIQLSRGKKHTYQDCTLYFYSRICFFRFSARQYRELILSKPLSCRYIWCKDKVLIWTIQIFSFCKPCKVKKFGSKENNHYLCGRLLILKLRSYEKINFNYRVHYHVYHWFIRLMTFYFFD